VTWSVVLDVFIPGAPKSKGSLTAQGKRMVENVAGSKQWRMLMAHRLRQAWHQGDHLAAEAGLNVPLDGPVRVDACFYLPVADEKALITKGARGNYDKDKLERNLYDAMTDAGIWRDDSQAVDGQVGKSGASESLPQGVRVRVWAFRAV
jgi:Holliday junction resolvase RusA-like endonuclease